VGVIVKNADNVDTINYGCIANNSDGADNDDTGN